MDLFKKTTSQNIAKLPPIPGDHPKGGFGRSSLIDTKGISGFTVSDIDNSNLHVVYSLRFGNCLLSHEDLPRSGFSESKVKRAGPIPNFNQKIANFLQN